MCHNKFNFSVNAKFFFRWILIGRISNSTLQCLHKSVKQIIPLFSLA